MSSEAIQRLREIAADLANREHPHPHAGWFAAALSEFEARAREGLELGDAFGFRSGWWRDAAIERRNELLREIHLRQFPGPARRAAKDILSAIRRYAANGWRHDREYTRPRNSDPLRVQLHALLKLDQSLGERTIRNALAADFGKVKSVPVGRKTCESVAEAQADLEPRSRCDPQP